MILVNPHLKKDYVYKDFKEMFPHLPKDSEYKRNGFFAYMSDENKDIIIETNINDSELLKLKTEEYIKIAIKSTASILDSYNTKIKQFEQTLKTLKEAMGE